ncbi:MAG TPA: T9SS type A sorting domain-containing protein [bacterium]
MPQRSKVKVELFNLRGQNLGTIHQGIENAGWPKIRFNASGLASGMYFCRVTAQGLEKGGHYAATSKMLLLK